MVQGRFNDINFLRSPRDDIRALSFPTHSGSSVIAAVNASGNRPHYTERSGARHWKITVMATTYILYFDCVVIHVDEDFSSFDNSVFYLYISLKPNFLLIIRNRQ